MNDVDGIARLVMVVIIRAGNAERGISYANSKANLLRYLLAVTEERAATRSSLKAHSES